MPKLRYDAARGRYVLPACEGSRHVAPRMYLGVDGRHYVGGTVVAKCPTCHQELAT
jgi:hypothetical protein